MNKKVILILLEAPIPFGGAAARWYYILLNQLIARGYDVTAFAAVSKVEDIAKCEELFSPTILKTFLFPKRSGVRSKIQTLVKPYSYMFSKDMKDAVEKRLKLPYDVIHLEQLWCAWLAEGRESKSIVSVHYLASIDLQFVKWNSFKEKIIFHLMKRTEKKLLSRFQYIKTCSTRLEEKIQEWFPRKNIVSIPFAIDNTLYPYIGDERRPSKKRVTLIASMNWYPGISAAKRLLSDIWPELSRLNSDCILTIVGWEARKALKEYINLKNVEIFENVPNIQTHFENSTILLYAPERGSGMKIKILESMLYGIPVVTTSEGVEGLEVLHRVHAMVAESNEDLVKCAHELLNDTCLQKSMRMAARKLVETQCSADIIMTQIEKEYSRIC